MSEWYPAPSKPRPVKGGGIRVEAARGDIGEQWWSRKWVEALERLAVSSRLERGKRYARKGQVAKLEVTTEGARAKVQGSRPKPYDVSIRLRTFGAKDWERILDALAERARFAASLLAGEVPHDIDEAFQASGQSLFPQGEKDLVTDCSCPDWENPCKHVSAVHYVLAEAFDRDAFLLFTLRGRSREELLDSLRARRGGTRAAKGASPKGRRTGPQEPERPFWGHGGRTVPLLVKIAQPAEEATLLKALGLPPVWTSSKADAHGIVEAYRRGTDWGLRLAYGDQDDQPANPGRRIATRIVNRAGRVRAVAHEWYVGRELAGKPVEILEAGEGRLFARLQDGSFRRLRPPTRMEQMPPEG